MAYRTVWPKSRRGLTILELAVAILLAIGLIVASISMIGAIFRADLRTDSEKVVAAVRYLYNLSVLNNRPYRLVLDQGQGQYWGEEFDNEDDGPCNQFLMEGDPDDKRRSQSNSRSKRKKDKDRNDEDAGQSAGSFSSVKNHLLKKRELSKRVKFMGVLSEGQQERLREGQAYIHFFPGGYVEKAYIYLGDGAPSEAQVYTIETRPLLGSGRLHREEKREQDFYVSAR
jgi:general secretion pathway protein H